MSIQFLLSLLEKNCLVLASPFLLKNGLWTELKLIRNHFLGNFLTLSKPQFSRQVVINLILFLNQQNQQRLFLINHIKSLQKCFYLGKKSHRMSVDLNNNAENISQHGVS